MAQTPAEPDAAALEACAQSAVQALPQSASSPPQRPTLPDRLSATGQRRVLLYLWSPRMVLSAEHAGEVQAVAQALGLAWLPVFDPRLPQAEVNAALASAAIPPLARTALRASWPLCDRALLQAPQTLRHFPTAFVYVQDEKGAWQRLGLPIVSAMPSVFWREAIEQRLALAQIANTTKK